MKYLIAGLGNIGNEYQNTRHNIGFKILDDLAEASGIFFTPGRYASVAELKFKGRKLILVKPATYMNLSGKAVNYYLQNEKIPVERLLVITDDVNLPFGKIRLKAKGSDGGHNGLKHIQQTLNTQKYPRLRFGVGNDYHPGQQVDYVLGNWNSEQEIALPGRIKLCGDAVKDFAAIGIERTMNFYNGK